MIIGRYFLQLREDGHLDRAGYVESHGESDGTYNIVLMDWLTGCGAASDVARHGEMTDWASYATEQEARAVYRQLSAVGVAA